MRKVKLLAFVLAALMVVAAFAGCGTKEIEANVSTLDERVTKLEELLNKVNENVANAATSDQINELLAAITANKAEAADGDKALADKLAQITADQATANATLKADLEKLINAAKADQTAGDKTLADAIAKISADQVAANAALKSDLEKLIDAAEKAQADGDAALEASIKALNDSVAAAIEATNKTLAEAIKNLEASIKESEDAAVAGDTTVLEAVKAMLAEQQAAQAQQQEIINATLKELADKLDKLDKDTQAQTALEALKESYIDLLESKEADLAVNKADYTAAELNELTAIIAAGKTAIRVAADAEKVAAAYDEVAAKIATYIPYATQLANALTAKLGTIKHDTNNDALKTLYDKVVDHYGGATSKAVTEYGADKRNLVNEYKAVVAAKDEAGAIKTKAAAIDTVIKAIRDTDKGVILGKNADKVATQYNNYNALVRQIEANKWLNADAAKKLVTTASLVVEYQARLTVLVNAQTAYKILGGYDSTYVNTVSVFSAYNALSEAQKVLYTSKSVYDIASAKLNEWMAAYSLDYTKTADKANVTAIIGDEANYDAFLANQKKVNALNDKYADFKANIVTRVVAFEKLTVINDANIKEKIAIDEAVKAWKLVWKADAANNIEKFEVSDANYNEMIKNAFGDNRTGLFKYNDTVKTFYTTTYAEAVAAATVVNDKIDAVKKNLEAGKNYNTVVVLMEIYGYKPNSAKTEWTLPSTAPEGTIKAFEKAYKTNKYDLTSLIHMTDYDNCLATVENRIDAYDATAKTITDKYNAIAKKMKDTDKITKVNLTYEASVNEVYALYAGLTGFNAEMATWDLKANKTDTWVLYPLLKQEVYEGVYELKNDIDVLRAAADDLVKYYGVLTDAFAQTKVAADDDVTTVKAYTAKYSTGSGNTLKNYFSYIKSVAKVDTKYVYTYVNDSDTDATTIMYIDEAAELGDTIYNWFMAQNGDKKYDAVETARAAAFDAQKLLVVKSYAIQAVLKAEQGANYDKTYGFNVCQDTAVAKILAVNSIKAVAEEIHHFVVEAGADYSNTNNTGAYIAAITFGADKDGNAVTVIGVNGDGVALVAALQ